MKLAHIFSVLLVVLTGAQGCREKVKERSGVVPESHGVARFEQDVVDKHEINEEPEVAFDVNSDEFPLLRVRVINSGDSIIQTVLTEGQFRDLYIETWKSNLGICLLTPEAIADRGNTGFRPFSPLELRPGEAHEVVFNLLECDVIHDHDKGYAQEVKGGAGLFISRIYLRLEYVVKSEPGDASRGWQEARTLVIPPGWR